MYKAQMLKNSIRGIILGSIIGFSISWGAIAPGIENSLRNAYFPKIISHEIPLPDFEVIRSQVPRQRITTSLVLSKKQKYCLIKNVYHEAGIDTLLGKLAVVQVTMNRLKTGRWGSTVCEVVYSKAQFSWTLNKHKLKEQPRGRLWEESIEAVEDYLSGTRLLNLKDSLFYHAHWMEDQPKWASKKFEIAQFGQHIFYERAL